MHARTFIVVVALTIPVAAQAQQATGKAADKVAPALNELLAPRHGREICYTRTYDAAHLRQHPKQKVREMSLLVKVEHIKESNLYRYNFTMRAGLKGQRKMLQTSGECGWAYADKPSQERTISCSVECDGGGVVIEQERGKDTLLVHLAYQGEAGRIRMAACGEDAEENSVDLVSGADDKTFRLSKAPTSACRGRR
jgi:hypothetical protein